MLKMLLIYYLYNVNPQGTTERDRLLFYYLYSVLQIITYRKGLYRRRKHRKQAYS